MQLTVITFLFGIDVATPKFFVAMSKDSFGNVTEERPAPPSASLARGKVPTTSYSARFYLLCRGILLLFAHIEVGTAKIV